MYHGLMCEWITVMRRHIEGYDSAGIQYQTQSGKERTISTYPRDTKGGLGSCKPTYVTYTVLSHSSVPTVRLKNG
jgi:hypothetical protein